MATHKYHENSTHQITAFALAPILIALAALPLSYNLVKGEHIWPHLLTADAGYTRFALALTHSAGLTGAFLLGLALILIMATRRRLSVRYRLAESLAVASIAIVFAGGGALVNEYVIKEEIKIPRPNIEWLASSAGGHALTTQPEDFYAAGGKDYRATTLSKALSLTGSTIPESIQEHWLAETGYSFPSGHSYAAFFLTTYFMFIAFTFLATRRKLVFYLLIPWAILVAYSRIGLMVHTPFDVSVGAFIGFLAGLLAWLIARSVIRVIAHSDMAN